MNDRHEEQVSLHALRMLDADEVRILESELKVDPKLREALEEFEETVASLGLLVPEESPPADLRASLLTEIKHRRRGQKSHGSPATPFRLLKSSWTAWAIAAALAVGAFALWSEKSALEQRIGVLVASETTAQNEAAQARSLKLELEKQVAKTAGQSEALLAENNRLKQSNAVARMEVATLRSSLDRYEDGVAVIVWDSEKQEGRLKMDKMPPVQANKDYQLWVVDKANPTAPISAGLVKVNGDGSTTMTFQPVSAVSSVAAFALSVETKGGVAQKSADGPIVLSGPSL